MLSWFVGNVDVPAAAVLVAIVIGFGIGFSTFIAVYKSRQEVNNQFQLAKMAKEAETSVKMEELKQARDKYLAQLTSQREIEFKRIESGMVDLKVASSKPDPVRYDDDRG